MTILRVFALSFACLLALPVQAQAPRDPTLPPLGGAEGAAPSKSRAERGSWPVIVVDGQRRVAVGTRLYAEGQMLGAARVERITETEVWLREGRELRKVQIYPGVRRSSLPPAQP
jgi:hypothetical protein